MSLEAIRLNELTKSSRIQNPLMGRFLDRLPFVGDRKEKARLERTVLLKSLADLQQGYTSVEISYGLPGYGYKHESQTQEIFLTDDNGKPLWIFMDAYQGTKFEQEQYNVLSLHIYEKVDEGIQYSMWFRKQVDFLDPENSESNIEYFKSKNYHPSPNIFGTEFLWGPSMGEKLDFLRRILSAEIDFGATRLRFQELEQIIKENPGNPRGLKSVYWNNTPKAGLIT